MRSQKLILASSSRFRKELLERLKIPFSIVSPDIDESPKPSENPRDYVSRLAVEKAQVVAYPEQNALVIGSDQIAVHGETIIGKPQDHAHAVKQLMSASGKKITLFTGLALINSATGTIQKDVIPYTVFFRKFSAETAERYLRKDQAYGCAGSLRAESLGVALLKKFQGDDPSALIGLPLIRLVDMLEAENFSVI